MEQGGLAGIDVVDAELPKIEEQRTRVLAMANARLAAGLANATVRPFYLLTLDAHIDNHQSVSDVGVALQSFEQLGMLNAKISEEISSMTRVTDTEIRHSFDTRVLGNEARGAPHIFYAFFN